MIKPRKLPPTIERLLDSIESGVLLHVPIDPLKPGGGKQARLRSLMSRAREVLTIDRSESSAPDGFPSSTPGDGSPGSGKGGGQRMNIEGDWLPTSSAESAALLVIEMEQNPAMRRRRADRLNGVADEVETELRTIDSAVSRLGWALDRWDRLRSTAELVDAPQCWVASVMHRLPFDEKWEPHRTTTFEGVLSGSWREPHPVCRMVYDFTRDNGRLPSKDEMIQYLSRAVVRVRTAEDTAGRTS